MALGGVLLELVVELAAAVLEVPVRAVGYWTLKLSARRQCPAWDAREVLVVGVLVWVALLLFGYAVWRWFVE